jgi:hypothetical protein
MAQEVSYWADDVTYEEGPFVICNPAQNGWRIEVENKGGRCPVLPDLSIVRLRDSLGHEKGKTHNKSLISSYCDVLNRLVKVGVIELHEKGYWYCPKHKLSYQ